jgi:probable rRNA maturation factor
MIDVKNVSKSGLSSKFFSTVAKKVLSGENRETEKISLAFIDKAEIKELNRKFRKKNKATDVLSFNLNDGDYLGEIVICPEMVKEKKEDIVEVFIHGILHLVGYDHERSDKEAKEMEQKQEKYFKSFK